MWLVYFNDQSMHLQKFDGPGEEVYATGCHKTASCVAIAIAIASCSWQSGCLHAIT